MLETMQTSVHPKIHPLSWAHRCYFPIMFAGSVCVRVRWASCWRQPSKARACEVVPGSLLLRWPSTGKDLTNVLTATSRTSRGSGGSSEHSGAFCKGKRGHHYGLSANSGRASECWAGAWPSQTWGQRGGSKGQGRHCRGQGGRQ